MSSIIALLQGPALLAYNNASFTEKDWKGIRMMYYSVKEADALKVGRFGLGFKSVFHMTGMQSNLKNLVVMFYLCFCVIMLF